ncbi:geranylgeranylglyceryl/heptaprenylglyceryl phosphate synthase [Hyunsoonleella sp. SJ7]|uniref:Geranylgeranylglyceryl phosphate synthase n=1 Tax=Hyunsoonleella aquatilis TaxID=2762758 RepID=A0A923H7P1_9FLAO|nr:geranylgeranylglyceryl/heptaprenylglyceryl phosphate synthase [Hyunsoonleella aquatilis]MBC3758221.1 geranylgeranylglyceryl/heptaprenylglyceryl phosphate synthase [Hyunsoonleella aquatilis]
MQIYQNILDAIADGERLLAVLIDPDKFSLSNTGHFMEKVNRSIATHVFVGGSTGDGNATHILVDKIRNETDLPVVLFPGDVSQITDSAQAILFLSLISGRNPEYLIGKHVQSVSKLRNSKLEVIPTGYILIDGGKQTAVETVTSTGPIPRKHIQNIVDTAKAGELLGMKLIYLEAGSGAKYPVSEDIIRMVKSDLKIPLIVGGGIKSKFRLRQAFKAGADMVVIGTAFEENDSFFDELK